MNQPRRSMSAALQTVELSPEAMALIKEGTPKPQVERPVFVPDRVATILEETPPRQKATRQKPVPQPPGWAYASFRLPVDLIPALMRASLDRKIQRMEPWTQQGIAAEAIGHWLKKNGYLD